MNILSHDWLRSYGGLKWWNANGRKKGGGELYGGRRRGGEGGKDEKLEGVGPIDNRPSTVKLHHFVRKKKGHVTCDM